MSIIPLRSYQQAARQAVHEARDRGVRRQLVALPTGAGKTYLAAHLVQDLAAQPHAGLGWRTLMVVHRDELVRQSVRALQQINPTLRVGVVKAGENEVDADVVVASAQTLAHETRLDQLAWAFAGYNVFHIEDEAHHSLAPTRMRTIERIDAELVLGLTATPSRGDKQGLEEVYEEIVHHTSLLDLMREGYLARLSGLRVPTQTSLEGVASQRGDFVLGQLEERVNTEERNNLIVEAWRQHAQDRVRTVAFCVDVAHAYALRDSFREGGIRAEAILGDTPADERKEILAAFHRGEVPVLTNCMVLTEGYDEPAIDCILMARPTQSGGLYTQMAGRGARNAEGKVDCLVIDFADLSVKHNLASLPSLAGEEGAQAGEAVRDDLVVLGLDEMSERALKVIDEEEAKRLAEQAEAVDLFRRMPLLWFQTAGLHAARISDNAYAALKPIEGGFVPVKLITRRGAGPVVEELFDRPVDEDVAKGIAQDHAEPSTLTSAKATWRKGEPSQGQLSFAARLGIAVSPTMSKGDVSEAIDAALLAGELQQAGIVAAEPSTLPPALEPMMAPEPARVEVSLAQVVGLLQKARDAGLRYPKIRLTSAEGTRMVLGLAGSNAREPGSVNVTDGGAYGDSTWYGRIHVDGTPQLDRLPADLAELLEQLAADPEGTASVYGQRTGSCCFCARELTEKGSVEVGYGPICAGKFGLAHPQLEA